MKKTLLAALVAFSALTVSAEEKAAVGAPVVAEIPQFTVEMAPLFDKLTTIHYEADGAKNIPAHDVDVQILVLAPNTGTYVDNIVQRAMLIFFSNIKDLKDDHTATLDIPKGSEKEALQQAVETFFNNVVENVQKDNSLTAGLSHMVRTEYLGTRNNIMRFVILYNDHFNHIPERVRYVNIDLNKKDILKIDEMFGANQDVVRKLLWNEIDSIYKAEQKTFPIAEKEFKLPNNFYFETGGIVFHLGDPDAEIMLPWDKVNPYIAEEYRHGLKDGFMPPPQLVVQE